MQYSGKMVDQKAPGICPPTQTNITLAESISCEYFGTLKTIKVLKLPGEAFDSKQVNFGQLELLARHPLPISHPPLWQAAEYLLLWQLAHSLWEAQGKQDLVLHISKICNEITITDSNLKDTGKGKSDHYFLTSHIFASPSPLAEETSGGFKYLSSFYPLFIF